MSMKSLRGHIGKQLPHSAQPLSGQTQRSGPVLCIAANLNLDKVKAPTGVRSGPCNDTERNPTASTVAIVSKALGDSGENKVPDTGRGGGVASAVCAVPLWRKVALGSEKSVNEATSASSWWHWLHPVTSHTPFVPICAERTILNSLGCSTHGETSVHVSFCMWWKDQEE